MLKRWQKLCLLSLCALSVLTSGCSGINATGTMSPATFFLPGLGQSEPPALDPMASPNAEANQPFVVAQSH
jgi:hypothetical protein